MTAPSTERSAKTVGGAAPQCRGDLAHPLDQPAARGPTSRHPRPRAARRAMCSARSPLRSRSVQHAQHGDELPPLLDGPSAGHEAALGQHRDVVGQAVDDLVALDELLRGLPVAGQAGRGWRRRCPRRPARRPERSVGRSRPATVPGAWSSGTNPGSATSATRPPPGRSAWPRRAEPSRNTMRRRYPAADRSHSDGRMLSEARPRSRVQSHPVVTVTLVVLGPERGRLRSRRHTRDGDIVAGRLA